jgi:hypothetical protein
LPYRRVEEEGLIRFILELEEPENDFETGPELSIFNDCNLSPFSDTNGDGFGQGWLLLINVFFQTKCSLFRSQILSRCTFNDMLRHNVDMPFHQPTKICLNGPNLGERIGASLFK